MNPSHEKLADNIVNPLSRRIDEVLGPLLVPGTHCALLDFPNHSNVGDSAIWLGEVAWLRKHNMEIVYSCDTATYSPQHLRHLVGDGPLLLHGGGNLGDLWIEHQWFRERVMEEFPNNPIIQLPQTIYFAEQWAIEQAQSVFNRHPRLTLLCRDEVSVRFAQEHFTAKVELCPDMAFALGAIPRTAAAEQTVVWLCRTDAETSGAMPQEVTTIDWLEESPTALCDSNRELSVQCTTEELPSETLTRLMATFDPLARERLTRGCRLLSEGRMVVTDRLHGHILCLLLNIPHIVLDNNYGKLRSFYETWTRPSPLVRWADSLVEALTLLERP